MKKHAIKPQRTIIGTMMKPVRIDDKTTIIVPVGLADEDARERFLKRIKAGPKSPDTYMPPKIKEEIAQVESVGSLEDLQAVVDESRTVEAE